MRNNLLLWMTGWDFATYNNFHRWVARVSTVQAVIHSLGYTILVYHGTNTFQSKSHVLSTSDTIQKMDGHNLWLTGTKRGG